HDLDQRAGVRRADHRHDPAVEHPAQIPLAAHARIVARNGTGGNRVRLLSRESRTGRTAMPRRLPTLTLAAGLTLVVFLAVRAARGDDGSKVTVPVPAQEHPRVRVTLTDKSAPPVEGTLKLDAVPLRTDAGTRVINVS